MYVYHKCGSEKTVFFLKELLNSYYVSDTKINLWTKQTFFCFYEDYSNGKNCKKKAHMEAKQYATKENLTEL